MNGKKSAFFIIFDENLFVKTRVSQPNSSVNLRPTQPRLPSFLVKNTPTGKQKL